MGPQRPQGSGLGPTPTLWAHQLPDPGLTALQEAHQFSLLMWSPKPGVSITVSFIRTPFSSISAGIHPRLKGGPGPSHCLVNPGVTPWAGVAAKVALGRSTSGKEAGGELGDPHSATR